MDQRRCNGAIQDEILCDGFGMGCELLVSGRGSLWKTRACIAFQCIAYSSRGASETRNAKHEGVPLSGVVVATASEQGYMYHYRDVMIMLKCVTENFSELACTDSRGAVGIRLQMRVERAILQHLSARPVWKEQAPTLSSTSRNLPSVLLKICWYTLLCLRVIRDSDGGFLFLSLCSLTTLMSTAILPFVPFRKWR